MFMNNLCELILVNFRFELNIYYLFFKIIKYVFLEVFGVLRDFLRIFIYKYII